MMFLPLGPRIDKVGSEMNSSGGQANKAQSQYLSELRMTNWIHARSHTEVADHGRLLGIFPCPWNKFVR